MKIWLIFKAVTLEVGMTDQKEPKIVPSKGGVFSDLTLRIKLVLRLLADPRVNPLIKLLPIGSVIYFFIPDLAPGPIDDAAILWLGAYLFVELCPPHIVEEHMQSLQKVIPGEWRDPLESDDDVIDAEYWENKN
jgi:hypothetical protein